MSNSHKIAAKLEDYPHSGPFRLDVAYAGGQPVGTVEKIVMDGPNPDRLGPYIRRALREGFTAELREFGDGDCEELEC